MKKFDYTSRLEMKPTFFDISTSIFHRKADIDETISAYFSKPSAMNEEKTQNYSRKKLINILEDVNIDANDAMDMVSKVNLDTLQPVELISAEAKTNDNPGISNNKANEVVNKSLRR